MLKISTIISIIFISFSIACTKAATNNIDETLNTESPNGGGATSGTNSNQTAKLSVNPNSKVFLGRIGNDRIQIDLTRGDGDKLSGTYFYRKIGTPLKLSGTIDEQNNFVLQETDAAGAKTGEWKGTWTTNENGEILLQGEWKSPKNSSELSFSAEQLKTEFENGARFNTEFTSEKSADGEYVITNEYPQIAGVDAATVAKFNKLVKNSVGEANQNYQKTVADYHADGIKVSRDGVPVFQMITYDVATANDSVVSLLFNDDSYLGGAHPSHQTFTINYDLKNNRELKLADLFEPNSNYLKIISDYCIAELTSETAESSGGQQIEEGAGAKAENFKSWNLMKKGLRINFDPYQVAAYAVGQVEVIIPYSKLKNSLKVFNFDPLQYANGGNPVNWCRGGFFPTDVENFRIAKVTGAKDEKAFFYNDFENDCPNSAQCKTKSYLIPGDEVVVSRDYRNHACSWYQPRKGAETVGWISLDKLKFVETDSNTAQDAWLGKWTYYDNYIDIRRGEKAGELKVSGTALWRGLGDNIHTGEMDYAGTPQDGKLQLGEAGEYECRVKLQAVGAYLVVSDNLNCGGVNVTFSGVYRKT